MALAAVRVAVALPLPAFTSRLVAALGVTVVVTVGVSEFTTERGTSLTAVKLVCAVTPVVAAVAEVTAAVGGAVHPIALAIARVKFMKAAIGPTGVPVAIGMWMLNRPRRLLS